MIFNKDGYYLSPDQSETIIILRIDIILLYTKHSKISKKAFKNSILYVYINKYF